MSFFLKVIFLSLLSIHSFDKTSLYLYDSETLFPTPIATLSLRASKMREGLRSDARGAPRHDLGTIGASIVFRDTNLSFPQLDKTKFE